MADSTFSPRDLPVIDASDIPTLSNGLYRRYGSKLADYFDPRESEWHRDVLQAQIVRIDDGTELGLPGCTSWMREDGKRVITQWVRADGA